jgi:tRNA(His) guanylyltransferase
MKGQYEDRSRFMLPRRTYTIIRVDGKAFHSFTRHCEKPNDADLAQALDYAAAELCREAQGSCFAYVQSDEISVLLTDFALPTTEAWFDGNLQKIVSVSASVVTAAFAADYSDDERTAHFDARVFTIPDPVEVENYFIWRQQDAVRNSIQGLAQAHFSAKQMHGVNTSAAQEMLFREKGINWNDTPAYWKRGRCIVYTEGAGWRIDSEIPTFTADRDYLRRMIPRAWESAMPEPRAAHGFGGRHGDRLRTRSVFTPLLRPRGSRPRRR